jgi:hypothetical protein
MWEAGGAGSRKFIKRMIGCDFVGGTSVTMVCRCETFHFPLLSKVDRLVIKTMADELPKGQISGGKATFFCNALRTTRFTLL